MAETFHCPNCGAPLDYDRHSDLVIRCPYCSSSVIAPEALRSTREPETDLPELSGEIDVSSLIGQAAHLAEISGLIRGGRKIEAIKRYREISGVSLKEAKDAVEALQAGRPVTLIAARTDSGATPGQVTGSTVEIATPPLEIDAAAAARAVTTVGAGIGCFGLLLTGGILLAILVPVLYALAQPGGPLFETWSGMNPFTPSRLVLSFGEEGTGAGRFQDPRQIAVDTRGNLYVADFNTGRIQRFDQEGTFVRLWVVGDEANIRDLSTDREGGVYAVFNGEIVVYSGATGERVGAITYPGERQPYFEQAALGADGSLVTIANSEDLIRFNQSGQVTLELPEAVSSISNDSELDAHVAVDGLGNIFILGTFNNAVFKFAPDGSFVTRFGTDGDQPGQFRAPSELAVDSRGRVYVSDFKGVQVFDNDGRYLETIRMDGVARSLAFNDRDEMFVVTSLSRVLVFTLSPP